jgi:hypothetical protein
MSVDPSGSGVLGRRRAHQLGELLVRLPDASHAVHGALLVLNE